MLSPSDYNNAVPQFTNGNYASNPINPLYIEEPDSTDYNRGVEPLQTLPAQWWNWFGKQFTTRFNKLNIYVKNIFNELAQLLSLVSMTPDGTEGTPTVNQLKTAFQTEYPKYLALIMYPVGSIYWTGKAPDDGGDPNTLFGGTWVQIKGKFIFAKGDSDTLNDTGGSKTVTLTTDQIPSHNHTFTGTAVTSGGSSATNTGNTQPTFTGSAVTSGGSSVDYTGNTQPTFTGMSATTNNPNVTFQWYANDFASTSGTLGVSVVTGSSFAQKTGASSATSYWQLKNHTHTFTAKGTVENHSHNMKHTHSVTASGTVQNHSHTMAHTHSVTASGTIGNTGGGQAHDNMPPYVVKYCWERTA